MGGRTGLPQDQPEQTRDQTGAIDSRLGNHRRLRCLSRGDGADDFHRLNWERGLIVKAANHHGGSKSKQNAEGVDFQNGDVRDDERNQSAEIAEGPGPFHSIKVIAGVGVGSHWLPTKLGMMPGTTYC